MASNKLTLTCEMQEINDSIETLREIIDRLGKMHGDDFRRLDRRIHEYIEQGDFDVKVHDLGPGQFLAAPCGEMTEIFREARRLCVIT